MSKPIDPVDIKVATWCLVLCAEIAIAKRQDLMNRSIRFAM